MRSLATLAALLLTAACSAVTENELQVDPSDVTAEIVSGPVPAGTAAQIRFTNHADYAMVAGGLNLRIDIWPDDRLWAIWDGRLYKLGGVSLAPGETKIENIDVVETLPPGSYHLEIEVTAESGETSFAVADVAVTLVASSDGQPSLVLDVMVAHAEAGTNVPVRILNGAATPAWFSPLGCGNYDVQQLVDDQWATVPSYHADACEAMVDVVSAGEIAERSLSVPATATPGMYRFALPFVLGAYDPAEPVVVSDSFEVH